MEPLRIIHFSDIHFWRWGLDFPHVTFRRVLGLGNLALRRARQFPQALAEQVLDEVLRTSADAVVFTGDLTTCGLKREVELGVRMLQPLLERWGDRLLVVPGNHDQYTHHVVRHHDFTRQFYPHQLQGPWVVRLHSGLAIVGFDCCCPRVLSSRGRFLTQQARQLDHTLEEIGKPVVLAGHYPYAFPAGGHVTWDHLLPRADRHRLVQLVQQHRPWAYLHGHEHVRWVVTPDETPSTVCVNAGSAGSRKQPALKRAGFMVVTIEPSTGVVGVEARVLSQTGDGFETHQMMRQNV